MPETRPKHERVIQQRAKQLLVNDVDISYGSWGSRVLEELGSSTDEMVALLGDLVRVPSVGGSDAENEIQAFLAGWMRREGLEVDYWEIPMSELSTLDQFPGAEVSRSEAWGVVGKLAGKGAGMSLLFDCHVDVVPSGDSRDWSLSQPFSGDVLGDRLYGRGACDMKAGLVAALFAIRALRRVGVPLAGDVLVAGVQGEEDGGLGTFALLQRGWRADACVIPEPTELDLVPANAGALTFRLTVPGRSAHASRRTEGVSAIEKLWPVFSALRDLEVHRNLNVDPLMNRWDVPYAIEIGTIQGGDWSSTVPGTVSVEGRLGVILGEDPAQARHALEEAIVEASSHDSWLRDNPVRVQWWGGQFSSGRLPAEHNELLDRIGRAHAWASGGSADIWAAPYGSDLRLLTDIASIPTVQYGPGSISVAHGPDEFVSIPEVITASRTLALLTLDICELPR